MLNKYLEMSWEEVAVTYSEVIIPTFAWNDSEEPR
jgi:hypothetical protein